MRPSGETSAEPKPRGPREPKMRSLGPGMFLCSCSVCFCCVFGGLGFCFWIFCFVFACFLISSSSCFFAFYIGLGLGLLDGLKGLSREPSSVCLAGLRFSSGV